MKKQWILAGLLVGMLTAVAGCNVGGEQSTSSVQTPPASESSAVVSSEEMSFESVENSADNSVESGENNSEVLQIQRPKFHIIPYSLTRTAAARLHPYRSKRATRLRYLRPRKNRPWKPNTNLSVGITGKRNGILTTIS